MKKRITITGMDTGESFVFLADNPHEAMVDMIAYLNLHSFDGSAKVEMTESGLHLFAVHNGNTYAVRM